MPDLGATPVAGTGAVLCSLTPHLTLLNSSEFVRVDAAYDLLKVQLLSMTDASLYAVPATWLKTEWGAHSPDAVIQKGVSISRPTLIGPGCFVASTAKLGPGVVLSRDVVVSDGSSVENTLVFPQTFIGQGLELAQSLVNGRSVQHLDLKVRSVIPASDGLLLDLKSKAHQTANFFSRGVAAIVCLAFLPWLAIDTGIRRARGLPLRWRMRLVALGRDTDSGEIHLQALRCARQNGNGVPQMLDHYGEWMDVLEGHRSWFGSRPRSQSEWYALGRDWQLLLARVPVGCMYAPAWDEGEDASPVARAAADVFFAVSQSLRLRLYIVAGLLRGVIRA